MSSDSRLIAGIEVEWRILRSDPPLGAGSEPRAFGLWMPRDPDILLDQMTQDDFDHSDERMPYFGTIWPSAESLVPWILEGEPLDGKHVLDLGCGLGPCGFAAAHRGARTTFFDWEPRALEIVAASAARQGLPTDRFTFVACDWRSPPEMGHFDRILAADVLYEERNAEPVIALLLGLLRPGGEAWVGDPGRRYAQSFPDRAQRAGLTLIGNELLPPQPHSITVSLLRLKKG